MSASPRALHSPLLLTGLLVLLLGAQPPLQALAHAQAPVQAGTVTLRNSSPVAMRIELRMMATGSCDDAPRGVVRLLPPGKTWVIAGSRPICWRRVLDLTAPVAQWTPWTRRVLLPGERVEATP